MDKTEEDIREAFESHFLGDDYEGLTKEEFAFMCETKRPAMIKQTAVGFFAGYKAGIQSQQEKIEELEKQCDSHDQIALEAIYKLSQKVRAVENLEKQLSEKNKQIESMRNCENCLQDAVERGKCYNFTCKTGYSGGLVDCWKQRS